MPITNVLTYNSECFKAIMTDTLLPYALQIYSNASLSEAAYCNNVILYSTTIILLCLNLSGMEENLQAVVQIKIMSCVMCVDGNLWLAQ